ncbi:hypothetical protein, partial [Kingella kingae]|uniref:hypothetical protein n=1 Tax=Kingella kingae TaxID=504 RepID=UPI00254DA308
MGLTFLNQQKSGKAACTMVFIVTQNQSCRLLTTFLLQSAFFTQQTHESKIDLLGKTNRANVIYALSLIHI